ncbi:MAG: aspartate ammonia-lyase [Armatimonadetes bacterium]|nr:aspartate ammonia-lyase [Armatimonadota bacterium]NIM23309.1 aspartate ammonia-lyase [Armatimonadota bacterium]NIM67173.1 aspartate ammonia-lyase [Armatimonadota bacterium]NIM75700.1 aspartate ammonia-lyase [Armatimonadota bacterium]NIN05362.1 aspartate ammonia-lyase [Armatimonadota bacterium]
MAQRIERDFLGEVRVPESALYGVQTIRATENFPISGLRAHPALIWATGIIKQAAAQAHLGAGELTEELADAISAAAAEVAAGKHNDQFVVDVYQAGAGTSFNMNVNEVIANRANELLGKPRGAYEPVHPNDHVNMAQSTNDVFPTAMRLAALRLWKDLDAAIAATKEAFKEKAREFDGIIKSGRTHLQDAVPIRLGQEFGAYATTIEKCRSRIGAACEALQELGLGGSAIGTGLNASPVYRKNVLEELHRLTGFDLRGAENYIELMQNTDGFVEVSSALRTLALNLLRICGDLRLMGSGPTSGLGEIQLPAVQPGSSIMPGKVNPVMAEMMAMVCFQVIGNDTAIAAACQAGQLELNVMMPVMAHNLLGSMTILTNSLRVMSERCIRGITANEERCRQYAERSLGLVTALSPQLGYHQAALIAKEAVSTGKSIRQLVEEKGLLSSEELERLLSPESLTES